MGKPVPSIPADTVEFLVELETLDDPADVQPPIDVL
jgi:hypothetical protein